MDPYKSKMEIKELICEIGKRMYQRGYVAANDGNISCRVSENVIWVTPTNVSKGYMTPDMLVKMDLNGAILEGGRKPSSEVKMHLRAYIENENIQAVVHAHPPIATAFAVAGIAIDTAVLTETVMGLGVVPLAPYALPGTLDVAESIAPYCKGYNGCLLANHGGLTWAEDLMTAYFRMESMEHTANILMLSAKLIGKVTCLTPKQVEGLIETREKLGITTGGIPRTKINF